MSWCFKCKCIRAPKSRQPRYRAFYWCSGLPSARNHAYLKCHQIDNQRLALLGASIFAHLSVMHIMVCWALDSHNIMSGWSWRRYIHSYLRGFLVCPQSLGCRHDAEEGSQLVYIPQKLTGLRLFSLINDFFLVNLHSIILPWWWNGRHEGLKIPWTEMSVRVRFPPEAPWKELTD